MDLPAAIVEERVEQFLFQEATEAEEDDMGDNEDTEKEVEWLWDLEEEKYCEFYSNISQ